MEFNVKNESSFIASRTLVAERDPRDYIKLLVNITLLVMMYVN